jgi:2-polyprenyl-6-hydroxyphenyl methylase / 3-demethylubiquinone-9 3-methyltransferase
MKPDRKTYPEGHWIKSDDPEHALAMYLEQQSKSYSRVKNDFVRELLGDLKDKRVLDYGCGGGLFSVYAAQAGASLVVGVDAEESIISTARYFCHKEDVAGICTFMSSEEFKLAVKRRHFDVILMKDVIEHVDDDTNLLAMLSSVMAPGGVLVLSTQNKLSLNYLIQGGYHRHVLGNKEWFGWDDTHVRFYTSMELTRKLEQTGLTPTAWRSVYLIPYKLPPVPGSKKQFLRLDILSHIDRMLGWIFPFNRLGWNIIVQARASDLVQERLSATRLSMDPAISTHAF